MGLKESIARALPALRHRNYRLFWSGQIISLIGTHMQMTAMSWLVYRITNSKILLSMIPVMFTLPVLFLSMYAGTVADRMSKRRLLLITQTAFLVQAVAVAALATSAHPAVWALLVLSLIQGAIQSFDAPVRQSFVSEMVPEQDIMNAVALNSSVFNGTRVIGPAVAGVLIATVGEVSCFYINAASFLAVIAGIMMMRDRELHRAPKREKKSPGSEMKEGFRFVRGEPRILGLLSIMMVTSIFGMPAFIMLPVFARDILHVGPKGLGWLLSAVGVGAFICTFSLALAKHIRRQGLRILTVDALFGVALILFSISRNFYLSMAFVAVAGGSLTAGMAMSNSALQVLAPPEMRGRMMGMYIFIFIGMMLPGSLFIGAASHFLDVTITGILSGALCLALLAIIALRYPAVLKIDAEAEAPVVSM